MTATPPALPLIDSFVGPAGARVVLMNDGSAYESVYGTDTGFSPTYDGKGHAGFAAGSGQYLTFSVSSDGNDFAMEYDVLLPGTGGTTADPLPAGYPDHYYDYYITNQFVLGQANVLVSVYFNSSDGDASGGGNRPQVFVPAHSVAAIPFFYDLDNYTPATQVSKGTVNLLTDKVRVRLSYSFTTNQLIVQVLSSEDRSVVATLTFTHQMTKDTTGFSKENFYLVINPSADQQIAYIANLASSGVLTGFRTSFPYSDATDVKPMGKNWEDEGVNTWTVDTGYGATGTGDVTAGLRSPVSLFSVRLATVDTRAGIEAADGSQLLVSSSALIKKFAGGGEQPYGFSADARVALITDPSPPDLIQMTITGDEITVTVAGTVVLQTSVPGFDECRRVVLDG